MGDTRFRSKKTMQARLPMLRLPRFVGVGGGAEEHFRMPFQHVPIDAYIGLMTIFRGLQHLPGLLCAEIRADAMHVLDAPDMGDLSAFGE